MVRKQGRPRKGSYVFDTALEALQNRDERNQATSGDRFQVYRVSNGPTTLFVLSDQGKPKAFGFAAEEWGFTAEEIEDAGLTPHIVALKEALRFASAKDKTAIERTIARLTSQMESGDRDGRG